MTAVIVPFSHASAHKNAATCNAEKIAKKAQLHFSVKDEVGASIIALDARRKKLIYAKKAPAKAACLQVDLRNIADCSIEKQYGAINAGELGGKKLQHFLQRIFMHLTFKHRPGKLSLPLYNAEKDGGDAEHVEQKARKWQSMISTLLPVAIRERA